RYIDEATAKFDRIIAAIWREIDLLREYRTRLVSDIVTGKLDVRGVEIPASEEAGEEEEPALEEMEEGMEETEEAEEVEADAGD
ncbi:MAG: restriction endonuclease subunit S, partial [Firmicutes bacterium]|nr:restriction endonuclease subunit S [Bacillota bacterium]